MNLNTYMDKYMNEGEEEYKEMYKDRELLLPLLKKKNLILIAKSLGIKYLTWMNKNEIIDSIIEVSNGKAVIQELKKQKYMCEHNKQKYKCILCDGSHICEHKKQRPACKICRDNN